MIYTADKKALVPMSDLSPLTDTTFYCLADCTGLGGALLSFQMVNNPDTYHLKIENGDTLVFTVPAPSVRGSWKWPITPGIHRIGIRFVFSNGIGNVPACFVDGNVQTPLEAIPDAGQYEGMVQQVAVGGCRGGFAGSFDRPSLAFSGGLGEIGLCRQTHSDLLMQRYTSPATPKGALRFAPAISHYWPCDEVAEGQTGVQLIHAYPSGDENTMWTTCTLNSYWESVLNDDANYIEATPADPQADQRLIITGPGFVKPAGTEVIALGVNMRSDAPLAQQPFTVSVKKGAVWHALPYPTGIFGMLPEGKHKEVLFTRAMGWGDWSQAELDGLRVGFLTGEMAGKYDKVTLHHVYATAYCGVWTDQFRDYVGGNHLVNRNALGGAERLLSYL